MMKRLPLFLAGLTAATAAWAAPIFTTTLNTQEEFDLWSVVDNNADGSTWIFSADNADGERTYYNYHGTNVADDWFISPAITPAEDGDYLVRYKMKGSSYGEAMKVYMASSAQLDALKANMMADYPLILGEDVDGYFLFSGKAGEPVYLAFHACSQPDKFRLYLKSVSVELCDNPVDLGVTGISAPVSGEGLSNAEAVTVQVKNCGLKEISAFTLKVALDGEEMISEDIQKVLAPGESADIPLSGTLDMSTSHHSYKVTATAVLDGDIAESNNTFSTVVRHIGPAVEPYFMGFEPDEDTADIKFVDLNNDSGNWGIELSGGWMNLARTGFGCLGYNYDKNNNADDWAFLDGVKVEAGHHVLKFWLSGDDNHPERLSVHYGNAATPEAMTTELVRFDPFQQGAYQEVICIFELTEAQTIYIGFHAFSDKDENWITIDDVSLDKISATEADLQVEKISLPEAYVPNYASRSVKFTVRNVGIVDAPATVKVYANEQQLTSEELTVKAQEIREVVLNNALATLDPGKYDIKVELTSEVDTKPDNNSLVAAVRLLGTPDILYDFEDEAQVDELTYRIEDSATLAPGVVSVYGDKGCALIELQAHPMFGEHMLACSVWFTDATATADRWIVFPKMKVTSDDACFVWNAGAYNSYGGTEAYSARVSDTDDVWYGYSKKLDVKAEGIDRANRGIELGEYKDKDIYVAINIQSKDGDVITFDNFSFFGCEKVNTGVGSVRADADGVAIVVDGDVLTVSGADDAAVEVFDLSGAALIRTEGTTIDLSSLVPGFYVARATVAGTAVSVKFVRR